MENRWAVPSRKPTMINAKLTPPSMHHPPLHRERLYQCLKSGTKRALTAIVAPFGCGKSALLSLWVKQRAVPVGWFAIDEGDRSLNVFVEYIIRAMPGWPESVRTRLSAWLWSDSQQQEAPRAAGIVSELIAVLQQFTEETTLVIDGYERIDNPAIHAVMSGLIAYAPAHVHLIVASRTALPFAKNMATDWDYAHIDAGKLALTSSELAAYFTRNSRLHLTELDVQDIMERTNGWITGVNAILSLARQTHTYARGHDAFYERLDAGLADLFHSQLMGPLAAAQQERFMRLAIPERFNEDLARHLQIHPEDSLADVWTAAGWMIQPVEWEQGSYILHPLLRSFLNNQLKTAYPQLRTELHTRCIAWLEERGRYVEAATCARQIGDDHTCARIITSHPEQLLQDGNLQLLRLLDRFPAEKWPDWPVLAWMYAVVLVHTRHLLKAEQILDLIDSSISDQDEVRLPSTGEDLRAYLYSTRSRIHMARNEPEIGIQYTMKTKELLGGPGKLHGTLYFNPYTTSILNGPYGFWGIWRSSRIVADYVLPRWGRLDAGYCSMLVLDGECRMEKGNLEDALPPLNKGLQLALELREPGLAVPALIALAKLSWNKCDKESAYAILQEGREHMARMNVKERIHLLDMCEIDFRMRESQMKPVRRWLTNQAFALNSLMDPFRLMEAVVMLRALFALGRTSQARSYGQRLLRLAESNGLPYRIVEIRLILAQNDYVHGNLDLALEKIAAALQIGMEQGYEQVFVQEGSIAAALLQARLEQYKNKQDKLQADYVRKLLKVFPGFTEQPAPIAANLLTHLSKQEQRVCQHIREGKSNAIIAQSLGISLETVKKHCQNMYRKLDVSNRREMIALLTK